VRSHLLRVRLGMVTAMAKVIEFYVPEKFRKPSGKWRPPEQCGKIIPFPTPEKKLVFRSFHLASTARVSSK
jgi:hypothetical protein